MYPAAYPDWFRAFVVSVALGVLLLLLLLLFSSVVNASEVNRWRSTVGQKALKQSANLTYLAKAHANNMARTSRMSHDGFQARVHNSPHKAMCENVAYGTKTERNTVAMWAWSSGHRTCMERPYGKFYGLGYSDSARGVRYWALLIGN